MKFDQGKVNFANSDRIQSNDQEFLTFRHNGQNNNTGRTVFSQKVQIYKQIQKGSQLFQDEPVRNFKKASNLRSIRSQQKYQTKSIIPMRRQKQHQKQDDNQEVNNNEQGQNLSQYEYRNEVLKRKIQKIIKSIKSEQKRQISIEKDIEEIEKQIEDDQKDIQDKNIQIEELKQILEENQENLGKLEANLEHWVRENDKLQQVADNIENSLQFVNKTSRQQDSKARTAQKLKQGIAKLEALKSQVTIRCAKMQSQIQKLKEFLQHTENIDVSIRDNTLSKQTENHSHFTC